MLQYLGLRYETNGFIRGTGLGPDTLFSACPTVLSGVRAANRFDPPSTTESPPLTSTRRQREGRPIMKADIGPQPRNMELAGDDFRGTVVGHKRSRYHPRLRVRRWPTDDGPKSPTASELFSALRIAVRMNDRRTRPGASVGSGGRRRRGVRRRPCLGAACRHCEPPRGGDRLVVMLLAVDPRDSVPHGSPQA